MGDGTGDRAGYKVQNWGSRIAISKIGRRDRGQGRIQGTELWEQDSYIQDWEKGQGTGQDTRYRIVGAG